MGQAIIQIRPIWLKIKPNKFVRELLQNLPEDIIIVSIYEDICGTSWLVSSTKFKPSIIGEYLPKIMISTFENTDGSFKVLNCDLSLVIDNSISNQINHAYQQVWGTNYKPQEIQNPFIKESVKKFKNNLSSQFTSSIHICSFTEFYQGFTDNYYYCQCGKKK